MLFHSGQSIGAREYSVREEQMARTTAHQDAQAQRLAVERRQLDGTATFHCLLSRLLMEGGHVSIIADVRSQVFALRAVAEEQTQAAALKAGEAEREGGEVSIQRAEVENHRAELRELEEKLRQQRCPHCHRPPVLPPSIQPRTETERVQPQPPPLPLPPAVSSVAAALLEAGALEVLEALEERGLVEGMVVLEENGFEELEEILRKICGEAVAPPVARNPHPLSSSPPLKYIPTRIHGLAALVQQARAVCRHGGECRWGWSRQMSSFVFLFPRHNRVVVERPEYGHATYFFELEAGRSTTWQLQRILAVLRVPTARSSMVDNRALQAGKDDLAVLKSFGWAPGMGLGSLCNFCTRVHHDYGTSAPAVEKWKSRIAKCLMEGADRGRTMKQEGSPAWAAA